MECSLLLASVWHRPSTFPPFAPSLPCIPTYQGSNKSLIAQNLTVQRVHPPEISYGCLPICGLGLYNVLQTCPCLQVEYE